MRHFIKSFLIIVLVFGLLSTIQPAAAAGNNDELFVLIGDSLMKAKSGDEEAVASNIKQFTQEWETVNTTKSTQALRVERKLKEVQSLLAKGKAGEAALANSLSALSSALVLYDQEQNPGDKKKDKVQVKEMLSLVTKLKESIVEGNLPGITAGYQSITRQWNSAEQAVHDESVASYGNIEKYMALIRIAITQNPKDLKKAESNAVLLEKEIKDLLAGKVSKQTKEDYSLSDAAALLNNAETEISRKNYQNASSQLNQFLNIWAIVEGDIKTRDSKLYSDMETDIPAAISLLSSSKVDAEKTGAIVKNLQSRLTPLIGKTDYTLWDAALILLREGFEGLLIVVALMAFLKKVGQQDKQKWIWSGVAAGVLASAVLAVVINIIFSKLTAASSREYIEGITGVMAVIMMLTVGAWLHNQSSIGNWNKYISRQMEQAIARGSLFSFAFISFLSVFREGAETIIFYTGITPYISLQQLIIGVLLAIAILAVVGFTIIHFSVKIPIHLFFKVATIFIYLLAFKILGISIHALQISNVLPTSTIQGLPFIEWIGLYPTLETTITQILLIAVILGLTLMVKKRAAAAAA